MKHAQQLQCAFWWDLSRDEFGSDDQHIFIESAMDYGLRSGITCALPLQCKTLKQFIVSTLGKVAPHRYGITKDILTVLLPAFQVNFAIVSDEYIPDLKQLTSMEHKVLAWASKGKGVWEIGTILKISQSTVKFHLQNVYKKLNVNNRAYAISKAIQIGLL